MESSILSTYVAEIRDVTVQNDPLRFRRNLERIGNVIAYEISKELEYEDKEVETPLGQAVEHVLKDTIVLSTILRAGIPFHNGFLQVFDRADNAFIGAYRKNETDGTFNVLMEYTSCPPLQDKVLIVCDPMLATGESMKITLDNLLTYGEPKIIHIATIIGANAGLEYIQRCFPQARIWLAALDEELTAKSYIVPGLGDAGDLAYGRKH
jgi:uracil phosphoribosyltransferase